jgi:hypothetical protein
MELAEIPCYASTVSSKPNRVNDNFELAAIVAEESDVSVYFRIANGKKPSSAR